MPNDTAHKTHSFTDEARKSILAECLSLVPFEGWSQKMLREAVLNADLPKGADGLYFPQGPLDVIKFWSEECDRQAKAKLEALDLSEMKIRDKVTQGVLFRLQAIGGLENEATQKNTTIRENTAKRAEVAKKENAAKRALSRLLLPDAIGQGPAQLWASSDMIWRTIGDTSTDMNYYSKRTILSGVLSTTLLSWLGDRSADKLEARAFLNARIENVMQFETAKWAFKSRTQDLPNPAEILGQLKYGSKIFKRRRRS